VKASQTLMKRALSGLKAREARIEAQAKEILALKAKTKTLQAKERPRIAIVKRDADGRYHAADVKRFSFARYAKALITRDWGDAKLEREIVMNEAEVLGGRIAKDATYGNPANMGGIIPSQVMAELVQPLRTALYVDQLGVRKLSGLTASPVEINGLSESGSITWLGGGSNVAAADVTTLGGVARLTPSTCAMASKIDRKLLETGGQAAEGLIRESLAAIWDRGLERAFMEGTGTGGQPRGVIVRAGNTTAIGDNLIAKLNSLRDMIELLVADNVDISGLKWFMSERAWWSLKSGNVGVSSATDSTTLTSAVPLPSYMSETILAGGNVAKTLFGFPVVTSNNVTETSSAITIVLADWKETIWADWGAPHITFSTEGETLLLQRKALIVMHHDVDFAVTQPLAVCTGTDFDIV
jgi:HK97 family phage major capsid protein